MRIISDRAWREAIELLTAYRQSAVSHDNTREVNRRRRAGLLAYRFSKAMHMAKDKYLSIKKRDGERD